MSPRNTRIDKTPQPVKKKLRLKLSYKGHSAEA